MNEWGRRKMHTGFWFKKLKERDHMEDLGINGMALSNWTITNRMGGCDWIYLAQDRDNGKLFQTQQ